MDYDEQCPDDNFGHDAHEDNGEGDEKAGDCHEHCHHLPAVHEVIQNLIGDALGSVEACHYPEIVKNLLCKAKITGRCFHATVGKLHPFFSCDGR